MNELPDEIWDLIKDFTFDWKHLINKNETNTFKNSWMQKKYLKDGHYFHLGLILMILLETNI